MISNMLIIFATVILFIFAVRKFSRSIERVADEKLKHYLTKATETPLKSTFTGFIVNAIIKSNTALTVTLVGLVDAGLITFRGALGVIIGSNVGNTLTSQLIAFNIMAFAPIFIVIGFMMRRFSNPIKHYSGPVFYFGLLFLTLSYLQLLISPYINDPQFINFISSIRNSYRFRSWNYCHSSNSFYGYEYSFTKNSFCPSMVQCIIGYSDDYCI